MRIWLGYRSFRRYRQIINVLVRNGFGQLLDSLELRGILRRRRPEVDELTSPRAKRLRLALVELGPTFIKIGQMLSTRPDILPADIFHELQKLQDQVPPVPTDQVVSQIESELKSPMKAIFRDFDETPIAAASIGQVHRAVLESGESVVVKIQRPNIREVIEMDIHILRTLAGLAERHLADAEFYDPVGIVDEFAKLIRQELDYTLEGRNMDRFAQNFAEDDTVYIPRVYWEFTTGRVLTMERVDGIKINQVDKLRESGLDVKRIAIRGAEAYLKQIFIHKFFHGDPHPGNIFVLPGEVIAFMDFGIVGRLNLQMASHLDNTLIAMARREPGKVAEELLRLNKVDESTDMDELLAESSDLVDRYYDASLGQIQISELVREFSGILSRHRVRMNRQLSLLGKVLAGLEGLGRQLDADFNMAPLIRPFAEHLIFQKVSPREMLKKAGQVARDYAELAAKLPGNLQAIMEMTRSGKLRIEFKHVGLEDMVPELERSTSRLAFAMIIAALVVGSALVMQSDIGPSLFDIPVIGALGYFIAAVSGFWLLVTLIRNRNLR